MKTTFKLITVDKSWCIFLNSLICLIGLQFWCVFTRKSLRIKIKFTIKLKIYIHKYYGKTANKAFPISI